MPVLALALTSAAVGAAATSRVVVTWSSVGPLRLDVSRAPAVIRFAGIPQRSGPFSLQYDCAAGGQGGCSINYFFGRTGKYKDRLIGAVLSAGPFRSRDGSTFGLAKSVALKREKGARFTDFCGGSLLRHPAPGSTSATPFAGLSVGFARGKVRAFFVLSPHAVVSCAGGGYFIS